MKSKLIIIVLAICFAGCTRNSPTTGADTGTDSVTLTRAEDSVKTEEDVRQETDRSPAANQESKAVLVLSSNELRYVDRKTGSSKEITIGTPEYILLNVINRLLSMKPSSVGINSECGAGPLKMLTWNNGLTVLLKENKTSTTWNFVGWSMSPGKIENPKMTTMANVGIGSTREEMESTYSLQVGKTSLGYEFSTGSGGLYGIFSGPGKEATITNLWSGISCVFR
jgi:hypothetical protein